MKNPEYNAQEIFDAKYITSREILEYMQVTAPTLFAARREGKLPQPIVVNHIYIWERALVHDALLAWKEAVETRRGG